MPDDPNDARLGTFADLNGRSIVAGVRLSTDTAAASGSAFVFDIIHENGTECLGDLKVVVEGLNLHQGIANSLDAKVDAIQRALEDIDKGNTTGAIHMLDSFNEIVEAQLGINLTDGQAGTLISLADGCISLLE